MRKNYTNKLKQTSILLTDNHNQQNHTDQAHDHHHLHVGPPVFALQLAGLLLELRGAALQRIGTRVQLTQLLVALQHLLDIHLHDADHLVDLRLRLLQPLGGGILLGRAAAAVAVAAAARRWR